MFQPQMQPRGPAVGTESSPDSGDSEATEVYAAAAAPPKRTTTPEIMAKQDKVYVAKPVAKRQREEGSAHIRVRTPNLTSTSTKHKSITSHVHIHSPAPRATGTQECVFTCGRSKCRQCTFNIIRQEPRRGPFAWQEMRRVTMCEHGEMAPILCLIVYKKNAIEHLSVYDGPIGRQSRKTC